MDCKRILDEIDRLNAEYLDHWENVCNIESPTDYKAGVDAVGDYFVDMAQARGWKIERCEQKQAGDVICITLNPDAATAPITVSGHLDTVYPVGMFPTPAVRRDAAFLYGPGVIDCKGGAVAAFLAMDALDRCGFRARPVQLLLQTDEETGSRTSGKSTVEYLCKKSEGSVAFLNLEGHTTGKAVLIRKGILRVRYIVSGRATHSSKCFDGANAIAEAAHKILELEKLKDKDSITCNCGVIRGGTVANTVADRCEFLADIRFCTAADEAQAREIVARVASNTHVQGCTCAWEEVSYRPMMQDCERNRALLAKMNDIYEKVGLPILEANAAPGGSDAAYITAYGIPCVDELGTEGNAIHSPDECAYLTSLAESAKRIAAVAWGL